MCDPFQETISTQNAIIASLQSKIDELLRTKDTLENEIRLLEQTKRSLLSGVRSIVEDKTTH